jgi:FkbM family methyltransferase
MPIAGSAAPSLASAIVTTPWTSWASRAAREASRVLGRGAQLLRGEGIDDHRLNGERRLLRSVVRSAGPTPVFFDVGANVGRWSLEASRLAPHGRVHAFEPHPAAFAELVRAVSGRNVSCHPVALGSAPGRAELHFDPELTVLSSLHERNLEGFGVALDDTVEVEVSTIDAFCDAEGIGAVDLVKIDVEGHELETLRGARASLEAGRIAAVQFEYGGTYLDAGIRLRDVVDVLPDRYDVFRLVPWGLMPLDAADLRQETFLLSNYVALRRD